MLYHRTHLFRWSAAIENWHRIHYDLDFAVNHDRNPGLLVQGSWKQSVVPQYLKDWTGCTISARTIQRRLADFGLSDKK